FFDEEGNHLSEPPCKYAGEDKILYDEIFIVENKETNMSAEHLKDLGIKDGTKTYANIQPKEGEFVYGILYEGINQEDLDKISHKEGVKQGHYSLKVLLVHKGEERTLYISSIIDAYVYIATEGRDYLPIEYRNKLLQTELKEGNKYLDQLELDKRCGYSRMKKERLKEIKELTKKALSLLKKPLTLEEARDIISKEEFNRFYRSEEIQKKYDLEKEEAVKRLKEDLNKIKQKNTNYRWFKKWDTNGTYTEEYQRIRLIAYFLRRGYSKSNLKCEYPLEKSFGHKGHSKVKIQVDLVVKKGNNFLIVAEVKKNYKPEKRRSAIEHQLKPAME
ncbi:10382_t:CDS:2, partial [Funneliformis geosporum]